MSDPPVHPEPRANSTVRVLLASLAGTTIEFFDFYIYATAAVLVFPKQFFPMSSPASATLESLATFALAFFARPLGSAVFGHFGDRIGRKATLVAALLTMGLSTACIGLLPAYRSIGLLAPVLLSVCRCGQGLGLGGEWGGAVLLATENAPPGRRAWFGMFPQLGAPLGFVCSAGIFLVLTELLSERQFIAFGWRIPFLASSVLVVLGLYVRLRITETPVFRKAMERRERVAVPFFAVCRRHGKALALGTAMSVATFLLFYLLTVFCLSWGTVSLGYGRGRLLGYLLGGMGLFAVTIVWSAALADRYGRRITLIVVSAAIAAFGRLFGRLFAAGPTGVLATILLGLALMGMTYGPLGTILAELFPTAVRYSGSSISFNLAGIFGGALAPILASWLAGRYGLPSVGYYLSAAALVSLAALWLSPEAAADATEAGLKAEAPAALS